ncbi:Copia protein [Vitis vinifera]|uniref:Copia protein n=1 Tax=Vitis vinifera TaxID=29760 RepID=A0A438HM52_VITVI|nr:Copia protein [Vitis vinifera]
MQGGKMSRYFSDISSKYRVIGGYRHNISWRNIGPTIFWDKSRDISAIFPDISHGQRSNTPSIGDHQSLETDYSNLNQWLEPLRAPYLGAIKALLLVLVSRVASAHSVSAAAGAIFKCCSQWLLVLVFKRFRRPFRAPFSNIQSTIQPHSKPGRYFKIWKERILLQLGCMDIDYAIRKDEPHKITDTTTPEQILLYERWEKSNCLSVMYIKTKISAGIRGSIEQHENVRELLKVIDEQFVTSDKALASTLIMKFTSLKLTGIRGVREHIMEIRDIVAQLKKLEVEMSESFLVHFILNTLPPQKEGLMMEQGESAMLVTQRKGKKGNLKPGMQNLRKLVKNKQFILSGNKMGSHVEAIGTSLDAFKVFKAEVEKQYGKQIKIVRSDRGGEYYGRYLEDGQSPGPFAKFLQEHGIVAQYTMPGSPDQNGVAERRNRTLLDMSLNLPLQDRLFIVHNTPQVQTGVERTIDEVQPVIEVPQVVDNIPVDQVDQELPNTSEQQVEPHTSSEDIGATLRRSARTKRSAIPSDYVVYLQESDYNIGAENDPESFSQAMSCKESELWYNAMKDEMSSMKCNDVWDLVELPNGVKTIGSHFDLELQQMDVKTTFLNGELEEEVYMKQPEGFPSSDGEQLVCSGSKVCFLVLYVDDILLATNDKGLLHEVKQFLSKNFDMKDMGEASYVIGIKIHRDRFKVGSLMYAQVCTRPDIAFAVGMLGRYQSNPGIDHWKAAKKVMRYLQGTKDYKLMYRRTSNLEVVGYSDSDFAGCVDSRKSTSGYIFILAGGAISWRSVKQTMTATSTMEAEFISCFEATSHGVWLKSFISGLELWIQYLGH